jgi:hypothetical protein
LAQRACPRSDMHENVVLMINLCYNHKHKSHEGLPSWWEELAILAVRKLNRQLCLFVVPLLVDVAPFGATLCKSCNTKGALSHSLGGLSELPLQFMSLIVVLAKSS